MVWSVENDEEAQAIRALSTDSDRAAAIVAAALVEIRLEKVILQAFQNPDEDIVADMFRPSGPLGSFSAKIKLAHLMGLTSKDCHADLETMKQIRNRFAHDLSAVSFDEQSIRDRTKNLRIVDHVATDPDDIRWEEPGKYSMRIAIKNCKEELAKPRQRYVISAMIFVMSMRLVRGRSGVLYRPCL
jgi:DNA-binding MltR family transcriptional regulator